MEPGASTPSFVWLHAKRQMPLHPWRAASAPVTRPLAARWRPGAAQFHSVMQKGLPNTRRHVAPGAPPFTTSGFSASMTVGNRQFLPRKRGW